MLSSGSDPAHDLSSQDGASNKRSQEAVGGDEAIGKKARNDPAAKHDYQPSRTIHVRGLPLDTSESDLYALCHPFGRIVKVLIIKTKNQGFIEFENAAQACALVSYYATVQPNIRGKSVFFQYSNRDAISAPKAETENPNHILLVTIQLPLYPITIEVLRTIFSKYGDIVRMVTFVKNNTHQALIEFKNTQQASAARTALEGQNIYQGCCTLRIQYSQMEKLTVKYNNDKSYDFENPSLPPGPAGMAMPTGGPPPLVPSAPTSSAVGPYAPSGAASSYPGAQSYTASPYGAYQGMVPGGMNALPGLASGSTVVIVSGLNTKRVTPDTLFTIFGVYGDVLRVKILYNKPDTALIQMATLEQAEAAIMYLNNAPLCGSPISINSSKHSSIALPRPDQENSQLTKDYTNSPLHRFRGSTKHSAHYTAPTTVLHLAGLPQTCTEDEVKALFFPYGHVLGFKFFVRDRRMGLLQMSSVPEAIDALLALHATKFHDSHLRVSFSKGNLNNPM